MLTWDNAVLPATHTYGMSHPSSITYNVYRNKPCHCTAPPNTCTPAVGRRGAADTALLLHAHHANQYTCNRRATAIVLLLDPLSLNLPVGFLPPHDSRPPAAAAAAAASLRHDRAISQRRGPILRTALRRRCAFPAAAFIHNAAACRRRTTTTSGCRSH